MAHELFLFSLFLVPLFLCGAYLIAGLPVGLSLQNYFQSRGRQSVTCPDNGQRADVEQDAAFAFWTALRGQEHTRLASCSRWPDKGDCEQECLAQVDASPENIDRLLTKWYENKACAMCARPLTPGDWRGSRVGVLDADQKLLELRGITLDGLALTLDHVRPLCWSCHQEERERQAVPSERAFKGERVVITESA